MFIFNKQSFLAKVAMIAMSFAMLGYEQVAAEELIIGNGGDPNDPGTISISSSDTYDTLNITTNGNVTNASVSNDGLISINGGVANTVNVNDGGILQINSGSAENVNVTSGGYVSTYDEENYDEAYGSISNLTVDKDGGFILSTNSEVASAEISSDNFTQTGSINSSKNASGLLVNKNSTLMIETGGSALGSIIDGGDMIIIGNSASANDTNVHNGGSVSIDSSSADTITIHNGGKISVEGNDVTSKGSLSNATLTGGTPIGDQINAAVLTVNAYGEANNITMNNNSELTVSQNGSVDDVDINDGAKATIEGTLKNSSVFEGGSLTANSTGAYIENLTVHDGASLNISTNATISGLKDESSNDLGSISGNTASNLVVKDGFTFEVTSSGKANNTEVESGGIITANESGATISGIQLQDGSIFNFTTDITANNIEYGGSGVISSAQIQDKNAVDMQITDGSTLTVVNGGTSTNTSVSSGGKLVVKNGTASGGIISDGGTIEAISDSAIVENVNISDDGSFNFSTDANVSASYKGQQIIIRNNQASNAIIGNGSTLSVDNGGSVDNSTVDGGLLILSNGTASEIYVQAGTMEINGGNVYGLKVTDTGVVNATAGNIGPKTGEDPFAVTITDGGTVNISDSAAISSAEISSNGSLNIKGGTASDTKVANGGVLNVNSGVATSTTIADGGAVDVSSGGTLSSVVINEGAVLNSDVGAILENINALSNATLSLAGGSVLSGYLHVDANTQINGDFYGTDSSGLTYLKFTNGFNDDFNNKVVNTDTSVNKDLELVNGDYTISNTGENGTAEVSGWNKVILSNANVRIESNIALGGSDKEFIVNSGSLIDASGVDVSLDGKLTNNGTIDFTKQGNSATDAISISGDYYGGNGALIKMNIDPATNTADKIKIGGNVSGSTGLYLQSLSAKAPSSNLLLVDAPLNTTGDASSFNIWRVDGSPFSWDLLFENNKWYGYVTDSDTPSIVPEVAAYYGLIDNTFMQTASLGATLRKNIAESELRKVACRTNKKLKYNNRICRSNRPVFTGWVAPVYSSSEVEMPYNYTASIAGFDGGLDLFSNETTKFGLLASYRQGHYNYEQNGPNYVIKGDAETTINSYLAGFYIRHDGPTWSILSAIYGGNLQGNLSTDDGVGSDISGTTYGATLDINYIWQNVRGVRIEPGVRISYTSVALNEVEDNAGKTREFDNASRNELEAGIRFAKRWVYPEAKAEIFFKPSIVQTINSGSQFELIEDRVLDSTEDLSLAKIEAGMSFDMIENWSASLGGSYSFGSDYQNTTANLSLIYNF